MYKYIWFEPAIGWTVSLPRFRTGVRQQCLPLQAGNAEPVQVLCAPGSSGLLKVPPGTLQVAQRTQKRGCVVLLHAVRAGAPVARLFYLFFFKVLNKGEPKPPCFLIVKPLCRDKSCSGTDVPKGPWCKWPLRVSKTLLLRVEGWQCTLQGSSNQGVGAPWKSPRTPGYCFWHQQSYRGGPAVLLNSTWLTDHFPVR